MAAIKTNEGEYIIIPAERAVRWWQILNEEVEPTPEEAIKANQIARVMLNSKNPSTPQSYLDKHPVEQEAGYKSYSPLFPVKDNHA